MVTHDQAVAERADRAIVLKDGEIAEDRRIPEPRDADTELRDMAAKEEVS